MKHATIDLRPDHLELLRTILQQHVPECTVWLFGSRVSGKAKPMSDIDLALDAGKSLDLKILGNIRDAFDASSLPMKVDIVDLQSIDGGFRNIIEAHAVKLAP